MKVGQVVVNRQGTVPTCLGNFEEEGSFGRHDIDDCVEFVPGLSRRPDTRGDCSHTICRPRERCHNGRPLRPSLLDQGDQHILRHFFAAEERRKILKGRSDHSAVLEPTRA